MAVMYVQASTRVNETSQQRDYLLRANAYAEAALRDFQHYQGRAVADEGKAKDLIEQINQGIAKLPQ